MPNPIQDLQNRVASLELALAQLQNKLDDVTTKLAATQALVDFLNYPHACPRWRKP